jgi:hypothetical protein
VKSNLVKQFIFRPGIDLEYSNQDQLMSLGDHAINIANKNCITLDFCHPYCSQNVSPYKDFEFLETYRTDIEQSTFLVDFVTAPYIEYTDFIDYRSLLKIKFPQAIFVTGDFRYIDHPDYVFYSGIFYYQYCQWYKFRSTALEMSTQCFRDYFISCLNRRPLNHRAYIISKLYHAGLINNKNYITFFNKDPYTHQIITPEDYYVSQLPDPVQQQFIDLIPHLPFNHSADYQGHNDTSFNHEAYSNSYINIVTESEIECRWFSEKVMKPLATGQMFLLAAGQHALSDLTRLGFDTFSDIIDHSRYDGIANWTDRLDVIVDMIQEYQSRDWEQIYKDTQHRRQQNIHHFFSEEFQQTIRKNIKAVVQ